MNHERMRDALNAGKPVYGPFLKLCDPAVVEIAAHAGFDFVIIDMEHGPISIQAAQNMVRSAELHGITPILRVLKNDEGFILRALDIGARGVQIPQIRSRKDAEAAVRASRFHPEGERGVCRFVRAARYSSLDKATYFERANRETLTIIHIEGKEGIDALPDILGVDGIDIVFLGPYDLSQSCGFPGETTHPLVLDKMREAVKLSRERGAQVGTFVEDPESARMWVDLGVLYISYSVDVGIFYDACRRIVGGVR